MELAAHFAAYPENSLIVVTNNEKARFITANGRDIQETDMLGADIEVEGRDESEQLDDRSALYGALQKKLSSVAPKFDHIFLCAPEALKDALLESVPKEACDKVSAVIPKNLAALDLESVMRILDESRE